MRSFSRSRAGRRLGRAVLGAVLLLIVPAAVSAHPLGNFTINHYSGLRVGLDTLVLDHVIDMAEIPAFQERRGVIDRNGDGSLSEDETATYRREACNRQAGALLLSVDGRSVSLELSASGLHFPAGVGGLVTLRLTCEFRAILPHPMAGTAAIAFSDGSFAERIGWREVVIVGDGATLSSSTALGSSPSQRLTSYPTDLLSQPLAIGKADATAVPGGPSLPPLELPDLDAGDGAALPAGVPGGVSDVAPQLTAVLNAADPTLPIVATALVIAAGLGAYHALTPGHGKTVMAAYLVGTRGNAGHALMLAATVAAAHTLGVLGLAAVVFAAERTLPPDRLLPWLGLASGFVFLTVGASLVRSRVAELLARRAHAREHALDHHSGATLVAGGHDHAGEHDHAGGHHGHEHAHADQGAALSVRSLFALGLSGGLVPAPSALLVFLGSVTLGRPIYGFVLVLAFGLGMAAVLGGVGLLVIRAKDGMQRRFERVRFGPVVTAVQFGAAVVVLAVGVVMTIQSGTRVF